MSKEPPSPSVDANPLVKDVAGHLFSFEEKIFGMSLTQLLTDLGVLTGSFSCTGSLHLIPRLIVCALITLVALVLVHGTFQGMALGTWLFLLLRSHTIPRQTRWLPIAMRTDQATQKGLPSVQATWVPIETLANGVGGTMQQRKTGEIARYWLALEIEGKNIQLFPESEQARIFQRFERFLTGLSFHLHFLSHTEQIDPQTALPLLVQKEALASLSHTPHLQAFQRANLRAQEQQLTTCTRTRHFVIISASGAEPSLQSPDEPSRSILSAIVRLLLVKKAPHLTRTQVLDQLRIRASVVQKAFQHMDMRVWSLNDQELLRLFACCLAPGSAPPAFVPELLDEHLFPLQHHHDHPKGGMTYPTLQMGQTPETGQPTGPSQHTHQAAWTKTHTYKKQLRGMHGTLCYTSSNAKTHIEPELLAVADLLAPSSITVHPDVLHIQVRQHIRYTRTLTITGYGHHLLCGWVNHLHDLGLPLLVSSHFEPIDSRVMIMKLEHALTKLESKRLSDQKTLRITTADQNIEAEQIRQVTRALASKKVKIFAVSMTVCLHAGTLERLEQRTRYVLSHLRDMQIQARPALYQQDRAWQSCLPVGLDFLQNWVTLTSDVVSTMLPGTTGVVGTPTGIFLGYSGSGLARRPVYLNPWSTDKKMANPHIVVIGETGQGKSWLGKTIATGLMGLGIADVVVLDKDDDYLPLHEEMKGESQRYNLARTCPINLFDLPFGPDAVDPDDSTDMLAEFFDTSLVTGLSLLVTDEETTLSKREEAYLISVARATYADRGITSDALRQNPDTVLLPAPTLADFLAKMQTLPASSEGLRQSLLERLEKAAYLFPAGQTSISLEKPLTIFSIKEVDPKWFALMTYVVQNFLLRHRALRQDDRYLAYIVEEASYLLKHAAGRRYLEMGSRGFRKLGIAQITLSQHPRDFLEAGHVVLSNAGTVFYLGMQKTTVEALNLPEELERLLIEGIPGTCVLRVGNEYAPLTIWSSPIYRAIFTTDPVERRAMRQKANVQRQTRTNASSSDH
jgi:Helicase HerA, central domain